jgi:hypothetical protein
MGKIKAKEWVRYNTSLRIMRGGGMVFADLYTSGIVRKKRKGKIKRNGSKG